MWVSILFGLVIIISIIMLGSEIAKQPQSKKPTSDFQDTFGGAVDWDQH